MLIESLVDHSVEALVVGFLGLFSFFVKSFFSRIHADLTVLRGSVDKLSGRFDGLRDEARNSTTAIAVTQQELKAVWKFIDAAHRRPSDHTNGSEHGDD